MKESCKGCEAVRWFDFPQMEWLCAHKDRKFLNGESFYKDVSWFVKRNKRPKHDCPKYCSKEFAETHL